MAGQHDVWLPPLPHVVCEEGEVHIWLASLAQEPRVVRALFATLSPDEQERADRFRGLKDREHFAVARGVLRDILGRYLAMPPGRLGFSYGEHGKPSLLGEDADGLRFNISHSHGLALYAVARGRELGLDIEHLREDMAVLRVADRLFSTREVATLRALPPALRTAAFFNCWTRKEAYIKALGEGLSHPLPRFTVSMIPGEPASILSADDLCETTRWSMTTLPVSSGYAAALVVEGRFNVLRHWRWNHPV